MVNGSWVPPVCQTGGTLQSSVGDSVKVPICLLWKNQVGRRYLLDRLYSRCLCGATAPPTFGLSHVGTLCSPYQFLSDMIVFWLHNEHFPPQVPKAIGFEDFLALTFCFARYSNIQGKPSVDMAFNPTNSFQKAPPILTGLPDSSASPGRPSFQHCGRLSGSSGSPPDSCVRPGWPLAWAVLQRGVAGRLVVGHDSGAL